MTMNKDLFKKMIKEMVSEAGYIPEEVNFVKSNTNYDGIIGKKSEEKDGAYSVINVDKLYNDYVNQGLGFQDIMKLVLDVLNYDVKGHPLNEMSQKVLDWEFAKDKLFIAVCDATRNQDFLDKVVHKTFAKDLAVYVRIGIEMDGTAATTPVVNGMLEEYGLSEDELFKYAFENSRKICPPTLKSLLNALKEFGAPEFVDDLMGPGSVKYVVKYNNNAFDYGAAVIFYEGFLEAVRDVVGKDFYLLPSSIHEMMIAPVNKGTEEEASMYKKIVCEINGIAEIIPQTEVLTNSVYLYDGELKNIC